LTDAEIAEMVSLVETAELYKQKVTSVEDMDRIHNVSDTYVTGVIHDMEEKLEEISHKAAIWESVTKQVNKKIRLELPILFSKTGSLEAMIGKRMKNKMPGI
jgi:hypothetical protein